jgi:transposase InsO family protein
MLTLYQDILLKEPKAGRKMNRQLYKDLVDWINEHKIREEATEWEISLIKTIRRHYDTSGPILYRKKDNLLLAVVKEGKTLNIISLAHDHPLSGHMGQDNTYFRLKNDAWWPGMKEDIINYIRRCDTCQKRSKNKETPQIGAAEIIPEPFAHIGIDVMGPLPITTGGKRYIILAVDFFTKYIEGIAVEEADAQTVAKFIHSDIICRHGVPKQLTSDRGTEFLNKLVEELSRTYHIKHIKTTAYHPQGNGQTERMNQTVKNVLAKLIKKEDEWDHYLDSALFAVRTIRSKSTEFSPFELVYGRKPAREFHQVKQDQGPWEERIWSYIIRDIGRLQRIRRKAADFISKAQERQKSNFKQKKEPDKLKIGDQVLLYRNIVESSWSAKLQPKWEGPYFVQSIKGTTIKLRRQDGTIITTPIHRSHIKTYHTPLAISS